MNELVDKIYEAAYAIFEPNLVKVSQIVGKRPYEFTVTVMNVPRRILKDSKKVDQYEDEFSDSIKSLGIEITTKTIGYDRKMLRFDLVEKTK